MIHIMNITDENQISYPGTNVATMSPVSSVEDVSKMPSSVNEQATEHLMDLFNRTVVGMENEQRKEVAKLLNKYGEVKR